jgi:antitoxin VapB
MHNSRHTLLTNGQDQILTIPHEFALSSTEVSLRKEGQRLIIEPIQPRSLLPLLMTLQDIPDQFPDIN